MNKSFKILGLTSVAAFALSLSSQAVTVTSTYNGNGQNDFDGAVGKGMLSFSSDGTNLTGTFTNGNTTAGFNDTVVIYIDDTAGGFNSTSTFTDAGTLNGSGVGTDNLRSSISGYNGMQRAPLNFPAGFGADYAIAFGPSSAGFGAVFTLNSTTSFTYDGSLAATNTGSATAASYTFTIPLSLIGSPTSFKFASTYLNGGTAVVNGVQNQPFRSNEGYANSITDVTTPGKTGSVGQDTALASAVTFPVPEPSTWAMILGGVGLLIGVQPRSRRS